MNFPLKGDINFLKNLKKGDPLYTIDMGWNPDKGESDVRIGQLFFDHFDEKVRIDEGDSIWGVCSKGGIQTEKHNLCYGFFQTPRLALEAFKALTNDWKKSIDKALKKDDERLNEWVTNLKDKINKGEVEVEVIDQTNETTSEDDKKETSNNEENK